MSPRAKYDMSRLEAMWEEFRSSITSTASAKQHVRTFFNNAWRDGHRRNVDPALLAIGRLRAQRDLIDEQIDASLAWARKRGLPRSAIAHALGLKSGGNLETVRPRHNEVLETLDRYELKPQRIDFTVGRLPLSTLSFPPENHFEKPNRL